MDRLAGQAPWSRESSVSGNARHVAERRLARGRSALHPLTQATVSILEIIAQLEATPPGSPVRAQLLTDLGLAASELQEHARHLQAILHDS